MSDSTQPLTHSALQAREEVLAEYQHVRDISQELKLFKQPVAKKQPDPVVCVRDKDNTARVLSLTHTRAHVRIHRRTLMCGARRRPRSP